MARKKSKIVKPNPQQVTAEKGLTPKQAEKFRNLARKPDSQGNWVPLSRARELAIGESIWNTYSDMAYLLMGEGSGGIKRLERTGRGYGTGLRAALRGQAGFRAGANPLRPYRGARTQVQRRDQGIRQIRTNLRDWPSDPLDKPPGSNLLKLGWKKAHDNYLRQERASAIKAGEESPLKRFKKFLGF